MTDAVTPERVREWRESPIRSDVPALCDALETAWRELDDARSVARSCGTLLVEERKTVEEYEAALTAHGAPTDEEANLVTARRMASEARRYRRLADQRAARHARVLDGLRDILGALPGETLADAVGRMIRERDALAARVAEFEEGIRSLRDSYDLTTGSDSPLPDLARDVVRGFFVGAETDHREPAYCRRCGYDHA